MSNYFLCRRFCSQESFQGDKEVQKEITGTRKDISKNIALKIIKSREELGGFKKPQAITKLSEFSPLESKE